MDVPLSLSACICAMYCVCGMLLVVNSVRFSRRLFFWQCERSKWDGWLDAEVPESLRCLSNVDEWFCLCGVCAFSSC